MMKIKVITESIIIPKAGDLDNFMIETGATAADVVCAMEEMGLTGNLTSKEVLDTHFLICNSKHMKPEDELHDGDVLIIIKTLLGG